MKLKYVYLMGFCLAVSIIVQESMAQSSRLRRTQSRTRPASTSKKSNKPISIYRLYSIGSRGKVETPVYSTSANSGVKPPRKWGKVEVLYRTNRMEKEWLDGLSISFYALSLKVKEGKRAYSLYRKTVHYQDVKAGARPVDHKAVVYIMPTAIERHGELVGAAVEISLNGEVIDVKHDENVQLPEQWWKNPLVTESKATSLRDSYMKRRDKSPFALINMDDYEVIK